MKQVIFDTDIGIDDAMALLFLHFARNVNLRAIVTGFGNASIDNTTRNALYVKERFSIDAPVYKGAAKPMGNSLTDGYPDFVHGKNGLGDIDIVDPACAAEALAGAQAIVDIVQAHPQQISLLAVGRMTNIARALELCPELPQLVLEMIVMGGAFGFNGHRGNVSPVAEANISGDPLAADKVFSSGMPLTIVGLDVTQQVLMNRAFFETLRARAGSAGALIHAMSDCYLDFQVRTRGREECPVHDPSAVAYLLKPDLFETREAIVRVATDGIAAGQTIYADPAVNYAVPEWSNVPACHICTAVDGEGLLRLFTETLASAVD